MNIASLLIRAARVMPERTAVFVGTAPEATYGELAARANALGSNLRRNFALRRLSAVPVCMLARGTHLRASECKAARARNRIHPREFRRARCAGNTRPCRDIVRRAGIHVDAAASVSYTHLTLPTNREV